jgi:hypothetical protein
MEDKIVIISRGKASLTFSANFLLIEAMKPCPCSEILVHQHKVGYSSSIKPRLCPNRFEANPSGRLGSSDFTKAIISFTNSKPDPVFDFVSNTPRPHRRMIEIFNNHLPQLLFLQFADPITIHLLLREWQ